MWHHSCFRGLKVEKNIGYCFSRSSGSILYSHRLSNLSFHANCSTLCSHWEKIVNIFNSFKNLKTRFHFRVEDQSSWRSYKLTGKALCFSKPQLIWMRWVKSMFVKVWKFESMKLWKYESRKYERRKWPVKSGDPCPLSLAIFLLCSDLQSWRLQ